MEEKKKHRHNTTSPKAKLITKAALSRALDDTILRDRIRGITRIGWEMETYDAAIVEGLESLGITRSQPGQSAVEKALKKHLDLTRDEIKLLPTTTIEMHPSSLERFREWTESDVDFDVLHEGCYRYLEDKNLSYCIIEGRQIPESTGFICRYRSQPLYIEFRAYDSRPEKWDVYAYGESSGEVLATLERRINEWLIERYRGCFLDYRLKPIKVKTHTRDRLIYPATLGQKVDDLVTCFRNWTTSEIVKRWGYVLIGPTGSGKTSIGGLIAGLKPDEVTYLYVAAGELRSSGDVRTLFCVAKLLSPAVLQIDDIDMVTKDRSKEDTQSMTNAFMDELDGLSEDTRLFTLFTTNDPSQMETAIINRAGRVWNKLIVKDYGDCLAPLLTRFMEEYGLVTEPGAIEAIGTELSERLRTITPDEVKNACQRLHLLHGKRTVTAETLMTVLTETFDTFHGEAFTRSHLERPKNGGNGHAKEGGAWNDNGVS